MQVVVVLNLCCVGAKVTTCISLVQTYSAAKY